MSSATRPWGFIGLGEMGEPMVANLLHRGLGVIAFDQDASRVQLAAARGATAASSVAEVARGADVISICVRQAAAARLSSRGAAVLDAPVSGMRMAAEAGTLAFFVGGAQDVVDRVRYGLDAMGRSVVRVGDVGSGQIAKVANNLVAFGTAAVVHEATELARAAGVDEERLLAALAEGSGRSWAVENWAFLRREWIDSQPGGATAVRAIIEKDLTLAAETAAEVGTDAPFAALAGQIAPRVLSGE
jgi:3-hydroxyisobutyrate dehydrogenase-like beta-hydroxyacid dehydrogenase